MRAIDTNVVIRFLTIDDPEQSSKAKSAIEGGSIFIPTTVLLETEWVLRSAYRYTPDAMCVALRYLAGLPQVTLEHPAVVARALDLVSTGTDFADALHLCASEDCSSFVSFDRRLVKSAHKIGMKVELL